VATCHKNPLASTFTNSLELKLFLQKLARHPKGLVGGLLVISDDIPGIYSVESNDIKRVVGASEYFHADFMLRL
jgi:hypothetical protein